MGGQCRFFYPPPARTPAGRPRGKPIGPGRIYADLIRAGYGTTPAQIGRYTFRQICLFFDEEQRRQQRKRRAYVSDTNTACNSLEGTKKLLQDLRDPED